MCKNCELKPVYEFTNQRKLCKNCFINWFNKKFFYTIRRFRLISKNDTIEYLNKKDFRSVVLEHCLKLYAEKTQIKIVRPKNKNKTNKKALELTCDLVSYLLIKGIIDKNINNLKKISAPKSKKEIKPLILFLDKEIKLYADLKKLKYKKTPEKQNKTTKFINLLEKNHPEIKNSIVRGFLRIYEP